MSKPSTELKAPIKLKLSGNWSQSVSKSKFRTEKLGRDIFAIQKSKDVCGGEPRVAGTRITVRTLFRLYSQGETIEKLAENYKIDAASVRAAIAYANRNREEIDELIRLNEEA